MLRSWKFRIGFVGVIAALVAARGILGHEWQKVTIANDTTRALGPLHPDGSINYIAALNEHYSQGVTPENNAAIIVLQIFPDGPTTTPGIAKLAAMFHLPPNAATQNATQRYQRFDLFRQQKLTVKVDSDLAEKWRDEAADAAKKPWSAADHPELAAWINAMSMPLDKLAAATLRPRYFVPIEAASDETPLFNAMLPYTSMQREITRLVAAHGMMRVAAGDLRGARADCLTTLRWGYLLGQQPTAIERLAAFSVIDSGLDIASAMLASPNFPPDDAAMLDKELRALGPLPDMVECVDLQERFVTLDLITHVARFGPNDDTRPPGAPPTAPGAFSFGLLPVRFDPVLRNANRWTDEAVAAARIKNFADRENALLAFSAKADAYVATLTGASSQSALKRMSMLVVDQDYRSRFRVAAYTRQSLDLIHDALDARRYFSAHPVNPETVRDFAATLPPDLFAQKPLHVTLAGNTLNFFCEGPPPILTVGAKPVRHDFHLAVRVR